MKKIVFATNNNKKLEEITPFLKEFISSELEGDYQLLTLKDLEVNIDPEEGTNSLEENAKIKATITYNELLKKELINKEDLVVAEDSGIFSKFHNYPGVITKREIEKTSTKEVIQKMIALAEQEGVLVDFYKRSAYYKSVLAIKSNNVTKLYKAKEYGQIFEEENGSFNYELDRHFLSERRGFLGKLPPEEFSNTSFRRGYKKIKKI